MYSWSQWLRNMNRMLHRNLLPLCLSLSVMRWLDAIWNILKLRVARKHRNYTKVF
jgi:hypothetical protein